MQKASQTKEEIFKQIEKVFQDQGSLQVKFKDKEPVYIVSKAFIPKSQLNDKSSKSVEFDVIVEEISKLIQIGKISIKYISYTSKKVIY